MESGIEEYIRLKNVVNRNSQSCLTVYGADSCLQACSAVYIVRLGPNPAVPLLRHGSISALFHICTEHSADMK